MGHAEQLQIQQYLGTEWLFGSGTSSHFTCAVPASIGMKICGCLPADHSTASQVVHECTACTLLLNHAFDTVAAGKDIRAEDAEVAQIMQKVSSNTSIPANKIRLNATLSNGTRPSMMFSSRAALINGTRGAFFNGTRGASRPRHRRPQNGTAATHGNVMRAFTDLNKHQQR